MDIGHFNYPSQVKLHLSKTTKLAFIIEVNFNRVKMN
jgi:hypothetical protein